MKDVSEGSRNRVGEPSNNCTSDTFHFYLQYTVKQWKAISKGIAAGGCHYLCSLKLFVFKGDLSSTTPGPLWSILYASQIHFFMHVWGAASPGFPYATLLKGNLKREISSLNYIFHHSRCSKGHNVYSSSLSPVHSKFSWLSCHLSGCITWWCYSNLHWRGAIRPFSGQCLVCHPHHYEQAWLWECFSQSRHHWTQWCWGPSPQHIPNGPGEWHLPLMAHKLLMGFLASCNVSTHVHIFLLAHLFLPYHIKRNQEVISTLLRMGVSPFLKALKNSLSLSQWVSLYLSEFSLSPGVLVRVLNPMSWKSVLKSMNSYSSSHDCH